MEFLVAVRLPTRNKPGSEEISRPTQLMTDLMSLRDHVEPEQLSQRVCINLIRFYFRVRYGLQVSRMSQLNFHPQFMK